jgi:antirestriction protein ArdC
MTENAKKILDNLVSEITADKMATFVRGRLFGDGIDIPYRKWSCLNQFVAYLHGTGDARGFRQWKEAGRSVKKGAKAIYILVPMIYKVKKEKEDSETEEKLTGFKAMPVFRVEDTEGVELDYEVRLKEFNPDSLPLIDVANLLGVKVQAGLTGTAGGWFDPMRNAITLGSNNQQVFLHELSHAVDNILPGKKNDYAFNEVVAELSSAFLASLYGSKLELDNTIAYIQGWSGGGKHIAFKVIAAMERVEQIYQYIDGVKKQKILQKTAYFFKYYLTYIYVK